MDRARRRIKNIGALSVDEQNTWLELSESMDRSAGIGFRCVADISTLSNEDDDAQLAALN